MKDMLKIAMVQADLAWEDVGANLDNFSHILGRTKEVDLVVLPEMFTTGFTMNSQSFAEGMNGKTVLWMHDMAKKMSCTIIGSLIIQEAGRYYNRALVISPEGSLEYYDKRHLFRMGGEHQFFSRGEGRKVINVKNWRLLPLICYDLRFPVWSRNNLDYDVLIYLANWPESRRNVWTTLLMARAIENQCYVVGVNRIGKDGMGINYSGDSAVVNPRGEVISRTVPYENSVEMISLSMSDLSEFRKKFPVRKDADNFEIIFD